MSRFSTDAKFRAFIINLLRKGTFRWRPRQEVQKEARVAPATSKCACCGDWIYHGAQKEIPEDIKPPVGVKLRKDKVAVDHREPVVNPDVGFTTLDDFVSRLFCDKENLQLLCFFCHKLKSKEENIIRKANKVKKK